MPGLDPPTISLDGSLAAVRGPTLVVDPRKARRNIDRMAAKARASGVRFRPHFKTHQSAAVAEWFREAGVEHITVSSVDMAHYFADHGWRDITIAFLLNPRELERLRALATRVRLGVLLDSVAAGRLLVESGFHGDAWIDVDVGYRRTGLPYDDKPRLSELARCLEAGRGVTLRGLLTHAGHSYAATSPVEIRRIYEDSIHKMEASRLTLGDLGRGLEISVGDTPTCSIVDRFDGVDEIRPGNFVFYDLEQLQLGACTADDLALAVACPVVAVYPDRGETVVHGGAVHLSKDSVLSDDGTRIFGRIALPEPGGWRLVPPDSYVVSLSQEHGVIRASAAVLDGLRIGQLLLVVPAHACLAADALRRFVTVDGHPL